MKEQEFTIVLEREEDGRYTTICPSLPGCYSQGDTADEAREMIKNAFISLNVFDVLGREIAELENGMKAAGYHSTVWNASTIASGVYFARFTATDAQGNVKLSKVSKLLLAK